ncbi:MAG: hypothetical protein KAU21_16795 [Gammaproteobacteria bacterium]|nr:hypothetical protein [Gammaproteobacteria bacterium]
MKIDGPLSINVQDDDVQNKRTLEITFNDEFQQLKLSQRVSEMKKYIQSLFQNSQSLEDGQADKQGLLLIMQICEQLLPHLQQDELDLAETISFEMGLAGAQPEISISLSDFNIN